jgi:hypothetical protein
MKKVVIAVLFGIAVACMAAGCLTACQSYQPPGEGIWRAL